MGAVELDMVKCLAGPAEGTYAMLVDHDTCNGEMDVISIQDGTVLDTHRVDEGTSGQANHWDVPRLDDLKAPWGAFSTRAAAVIAGCRKATALANSPEVRACERIEFNIADEIRRLGGPPSLFCESPTHQFDLVTSGDEYAARVELPNGAHQLYDMRGGLLHPKGPYHYCDPMRERLPWAAFIVFAAQYVTKWGVQHATYLRGSPAWQRYMERANDIQWEVAELEGTTHL